MNIGKIIAVAGPVVDVAFEKGELPRIREALTVRVGGETRVMEVAQQIGGSAVRCIMLAPSDRRRGRAARADPALAGTPQSAVFFRTEPGGGNPRDGH